MNPYRPLFTLLALTACGATTQPAPVANRDAGPGSASTCGGSISFNLAVASEGRVYYGGGQPPWPAQSTCPTWLTITHAGEALILEKNNCDHSCPASQPQAATSQSLTWDGTYFPIASVSGNPGACPDPACAPAGDYVATFCVASAIGEGDSGTTEAPPTCRTVSFIWPPSGARGEVSTAISPTPKG